MGFYVVNILCIMTIIAVHEYGHFFFAKRYGVIPPNFSIGFGPEILGFNHSGTRYSLRPIPLGGYVTLGDGDLDPLTKWQKIKFYLGGPLANLLLCIVAAIIAVSMGIIPEVVKDSSWFVLIAFAVVGTTLLFVAAVPLTIYVLFDILLHPIASIDKIAGPIGIFSGKAISGEIFELLGYSGQAIITIWVISLAIGSFNLIPLSILDGGRIFGEIFSKHPRFMKAWNLSSGTALAALILYVIVADIVKMF